MSLCPLADLATSLGRRAVRLEDGPGEETRAALAIVHVSVGIIEKDVCLGYLCQHWSSTASK